jgi:hypothetical protein
VKPTTLHKQARRRERSPVLPDLSIYGPMFRRLQFRWRRVQLPLFPAVKREVA